jgi:hypothetical protein
MNELPYTVSVRDLDRRGACGYQRDIFVRAFGLKRVPVTRENFLKASRAGLDTSWLHQRFGRKLADKGLITDWQRVELMRCTRWYDPTCQWRSIVRLHKAAMKLRATRSRVRR